MYMLSWDDLRLFLAVARQGRFTAAGRSMGVNHTTIARRMTALEEALGARLFDRTSRGVTITLAGSVLLEHAERAEREFDEAAAALSGREQAISGAVRLATAEAFGTYMIAPYIAEFHARYPDLLLELMPESRSVSLANREADIAITIDRPPRGRLVVRKLTDYRLGLYASAEYLERHGPIHALEDIAAHPFVGYIDQMIDMPGLRYLSEVTAEARTVFRSSSIVAQQRAVLSGVGLGLLHRFSAESEQGLVRILPKEVEITRSYWLVLRPEHQKSSRTRAVIDFMDELITRFRPLL
jgi:DNA-binding transcriptional LysR family regulator